MRALRYIREWWWFPENKLVVVFSVWVTLMTLIMIFGERVPT